MMQLKISLPSATYIDLKTNKITAEDIKGSFCLLPKHIDCVRILVPGLLIYETEDNKENYVAIDEGILIKCKDEVSVCTKNAIKANLGEIEKSMKDKIEQIEDYEKKSRKILTELEVDFIKRYTETQKL